MWWQGLRGDIEKGGITPFRVAVVFFGGKV
jgi:hypothetical protein